MPAYNKGNVIRGGLGAHFGESCVMRTVATVFVIVLVGERRENESGQSWFRDFTADPCDAFEYRNHKKERLSHEESFHNEGT
jgi:hypothetical protein